MLKISILIFGLTLKILVPFLQLPIERAAAASDDLSMGLSQYQNGQFEMAQKTFQNALALDSENSFILYNLGLAEYKLGKQGLAIGLWRKAIDINPSFVEATEALKYAISKLQLSELPHIVKPYETIRNAVMFRFAPDVYFGGGFISCFLILWIWGRFWVARKKAIDSDGPGPKVTFVQVLITAFSMVGLFLAVFRGYDQFVPRGTVIVPKAQVHAGPSTEQASLFELSEGFEVLILKVESDWVQVQYPGGRTGWTQKSELIHSSGRSPW